MPLIPDLINGVTIKFKPEVDREVEQGLIEALRQTIEKFVCGRRLRDGDLDVFGHRPKAGDLDCPRDAGDLEPSGQTVLASITISEASTTTGHATNSRHYVRKAVDISRVNDRKIVEYPNDPSVRAFVRALQLRFDGFAMLRRENFGPCGLRKLGAPYSGKNPKALAKQHGNHIHFSVN